MKTIIIDESKWRCGGNGNKGYRLGKGDTMLMNNKGYMCCLGQVSLQLGATKDQIVGLECPHEMRLRFKPLTRSFRGVVTNTQLSNTAMDINDNWTITVAEKKKRLRKLFRSKGYKLVFQKPKTK